MLFEVTQNRTLLQLPSEEKEYILKSILMSWAVVVYTFNLSTREAEAGEYLSSKPASSTE